MMLIKVECMRVTVNAGGSDVRVLLVITAAAEVEQRG